MSSNDPGPIRPANRVNMSVLVEGGEVLLSFSYARPSAAPDEKALSLGPRVHMAPRMFERMARQGLALIEKQRQQLAEAKEAAEGAESNVVTIGSTG